MISFYLSIIENEEDKFKFEYLYKTYAQDMYAISYDILKNKMDAEDAVHQSFIKIAENFTKVSLIPCNEIKAYIVIIVRNTAINLYRNNKYRAEHSTVLTNDITDDSFEKNDYSELVEAIKSLPQIYKDVLYLFYLQEFSAKETAQMLYISDNAVRQRAMRAKIMLKEILERGGQGEQQ